MSAKQDNFKGRMLGSASSGEQKGPKLRAQNVFAWHGLQVLINEQLTFLVNAKQKCWPVSPPPSKKNPSISRKNIMQRNPPVLGEETEFPNVFEPDDTFGILTQHNGHSHKMAAKGGRVLGKVLADTMALTGTIHKTPSDLEAGRLLKIQFTQTRNATNQWHLLHARKCSILQVQKRRKPAGRRPENHFL